MSYIKEFEAELARRLDDPGENATVVRWAGERLLESYKNGRTAGRKGGTLRREGQSRRRTTARTTAPVRE